MSVGLLSRDLYKTSIQEDFNLYSQSATTLKKCYTDMCACKGEWSQTVKDLPNLNTQKKEEIFNTALTKYHTFIKTAEFASKLLERLQETCTRCTRPEISPDTYITMIRLGENAETFRQEVEALATVRDHLETLATRIQTVLKGDIDTRLPQIVVPLEQLIGAIRPPLAGWSIGGWRTPALNAAYETWITNATDAQKNWTPEKDETILNSASFGSVEPSLSNLNRALQTLNLTYVDPETKIAYGANSNQESTKSQGKEEEPTSPILKQNDAPPRSIQTHAKSETTSKNAMQKKEDAKKTSSENELSVQSEEDIFSTFSEDISLRSDKVFDPSKFDATESESEEVESTFIDKISSESNSQQSSTAPILEKMTPSSSPKVNAQEYAFEALERATNHVEEEMLTPIVPLNKRLMDCVSAPVKKTPEAESSSKPAQPEKVKPPVRERKNTPAQQKKPVHARTRNQAIVK